MGLGIFLFTALVAGFIIAGQSRKKNKKEILP
jgi:hypothetical protein